MKGIFRRLMPLIGLAVVSWLAFAAWSVYSTLRSANVARGGQVTRLPELPGSGTTGAVPSRNSELLAVRAGGLTRSEQSDPGDELQPASGVRGCDRFDGPPPSGQPLVDGSSQRGGRSYGNAPKEILAELAMAGDDYAQYALGVRLQQELFREKDRSSYRFEYMRNFLVLAIKHGYQGAPELLADIYAYQKRDVVEIAAWLRIGASMRGRPGLERAEKFGLVLSEEQRVESQRLAEELTEFYGLTLVRGGTRGTGGTGVVSDDRTSYTATTDCVLEEEDPYYTAIAELEAYRADLGRNSGSPGVVPEAELRRRFRAIRHQFVTSLRQGNEAAVAMLVTMHGESSADEDAVAAAVWDEVGRKRYYTGSGSKPSDPASSASTDGVAVSTLADQYIMMFELDGASRHPLEGARSVH